MIRCLHGILKFFRIKNEANIILLRNHCFNKPIKHTKIYYYIAFFSHVHAIFPFVHAGFGLAEMIVERTNVIRKSIPDWEGWNELDNWNDEKYGS